MITIDMDQIKQVIQVIERNDNIEYSKEIGLICAHVSYHYRDK